MPNDPGTAETRRSTAPSAASSSIPSAGATNPAPVKPTPAPAPRAPLITAVEIENFKGIGRPVRIDLRPITLLFGRNSAGKSTVLHALCYAHEILNHRSVDAHGVDLGGDQIDLGGFRRLIHGHDLDRSVRMRFDLNLDGWRVPQPLLNEMRRLEDDETVTADSWNDWLPAHDMSGFARSGWVALAAKWNPDGNARAEVDSYEVGLNGCVLGRIRTAGSAETKLAINPEHPVFATYGDLSIYPDSPAYSQVNPGADSAASPGTPPSRRNNDAQLHDVADWGDSPLPQWDDIEFFPHDDEPIPTGRADGEFLEVGYPGSVAFAQFRALVSGALVGIGRTLRDELAQLRYVGPVRRLRPPDTPERASSTTGSWSDGAAAWSLLANAAPDLVSDAPTLLDGVNDWLSRPDRLDVGYRLQHRTSVTLPADAPPISTIRFIESALGECRDQAGEVDLDRWIREEAAEIAAISACDAEPVEASLRSSGDLKEATDVDTSDHLDSDVAGLVSNARKLLLAYRRLLTAVEDIESGRNPSAVKDLVRAVATSPSQPTLQLLTAASDLPVRTSDVGVGISQLLPVVVAALDPNRPGITAIEQPELHAHPKLQVELGDLFAHAADDQRVFLLENHSEHLMLRLLRRIEGTHNGELPEEKPELRPDQVSVVYLDQVDGEVQATRLRIDETGEFIDRWPHGFFDERADELF